jgi:hypothetical protein
MDKFCEDCHTVVRPFADHIKDKKGLMAEELCIPKLWIESVKLVDINDRRPVKIDSDLRLGNVR